MTLITTTSHCIVTAAARILLILTQDIREIGTYVCLYAAYPPNPHDKHTRYVREFPWLGVLYVVKMSTTAYIPHSHMIVRETARDE